MSQRIPEEVKKEIAKIAIDLYLSEKTITYEELSQKLNAKKLFVGHPYGKMDPTIIAVCELFGNITVSDLIKSRYTTKSGRPLKA